MCHLTSGDNGVTLIEEGRGSNEYKGVSCHALSMELRAYYVWWKDYTGVLGLASGYWRKKLNTIRSADRFVYGFV